MIETIKRHPYMTGGVVFVGAIVVYMMLNSGGADIVESGPPSYSSVGYGSGMVEQNNNAIAAGQLQLEAMNVQAATNVTIAELAAQSRNFEIGKTAEVSLAKITADKNVATLTSTLAAEVKGREIAATERVALADYANQQSLASINAQQQVQTSAILAGTQLAMMQSTNDLQKTFAELDYAKTIVRENAAFATANVQMNAIAAMNNVNANAMAALGKGGY